MPMEVVVSLKYGSHETSTLISYDAKHWYIEDVRGVHIKNF